MDISISAMGMAFHTSPLKMAITRLMNTTQRTRNHSREFLLSVTATTVTRKPKEETSRLPLQVSRYSKGSPHHRPRSLGGVKRRKQRKHLLQTTTASAGWKPACH